MFGQCATEAKKANNNSARDQKRKLNRAAVSALKSNAQKKLINHYFQIDGKSYSGLSHTGAKENTFVNNSGQTIYNTGTYAGVTNHGSFIVGGQSNVTTYEGGGGARTAAERSRRTCRNCKKRTRKRRMVKIKGGKLSHSTSHFLVMHR